MASLRRLRAVNGDLVELSSRGAVLDAPFTSTTDVLFDGVTHQLLSTKDRSAFDFRHTVGEFEISGFPGLILEHLDNVATSARHRHQALVVTDRGVLSTNGYDGTEHLLALLGHLRPYATPEGVAVRPRPGADISSPTVALTSELAGVIEISPLTSSVIDQLPTWSGTPVDFGDLYAGEMTGGIPYLTLVTATCRLLAFPGKRELADDAAAMISRLDVRWQT